MPKGTKRIFSYRVGFFAAVIGGLIGISINNIPATLGYIADTLIYAPPDYLTFQPPAAGGSYTDPVFGTAIKRVSDSMHTTDVSRGGIVTLIGTEYSTMSPFNLDNSRLLLLHFSYFALYDGDGNFLKNMPMEVNASSQPRWSRTDANVFYYISGNRLKQYNVGTNTGAVVHTFSEYSAISGNGESDISFDGDHFVLAGNSRYVFVYEISTDTKGPAFDTNGHGFDSMYITPDGNVTITWYANGSSRYNGIELFDKNMNFLRQLTHAGGHMDVTRDVNGDEVLVWAAAADPQLQVSCDAGVVKVRLSDGKQTCVWRGDWSMAVHVSAPDKGGWAVIETYTPSDPIPPARWTKYTNELLQVKLDGTEVRRLAHHRSRPFNSYTYTPKAALSHDGTKLAYASNFGLQALGYPTNYSDAYLIDLATASPDSIASGGGSPSSGGTPPPPPPSGGTGATTTTITRVEENAAAVAYAGEWYPNAAAVHSAGRAAGAMTAGSRATLTFDGTGVSVVVYRDEWSGIARILVDGAPQGEVDTYSAPSKARNSIYKISNLPSGSHTVAIEATGRKSAGSGGAWIWVDAFDVESGVPATGIGTPTPAPAPAPPTPTGTLFRVEQDKPAVQYSNSWYVNNNAVHSGGSAKLQMKAGSKASFTFVGTSVSWIALQDQWAGIASVYIDGTHQADVDTYASPQKAKTAVYTAAGLPWGSHTITIEVAGRRSPASRGNWIWLDAFEYVGAPLP